MPSPLPSTLPDSFGAVAGARRGLDVDLSDPRVVAFAEQFAVDVSRIDDALRAGFLEATGPSAFTVVQAIYVDDFWPRVPAVLDAVIGPVHWPDAEPTDAELWPLLEEFMREVARLDALDPVTTELVRLRGARQHDCRLCKSRRSVAAIDAGADESTFDAVDDFAESDLSRVGEGGSRADGRDDLDAVRRACGGRRGCARLPPDRAHRRGGARRDPQRGQQDRGRAGCRRRRRSPTASSCSRPTPTAT